MSIELGFLETRVARRLFLRFVLCAVLPIAVLAALSYSAVTANLRERGDLRIREVALATERSVRDRLDRARDDLTLLVGVVGTESGAYARSTQSLDDVRDGLIELPRPKGFASLVVAAPAGESEVVFGEALRVPSLDDAQLAHLAAGKVLLVEVGGDSAQIWIGKTIPALSRNPPIVWAQLDSDDLVETGAQLAALPDDGGLYVLNASFAALHGPASADRALRDGLEAAVATKVAGLFTWKSEQAGSFRSVTRPIFLGDEYRSEDWFVVANVREQSVLAPLRGSTTAFFPFLGVALLIVMLFSVSEIRRTILPLRQLHEATQRISSEDFDARVAVTTGDEFQDLAGSFNGMAQSLGQQFKVLTAMQQLDRVGLSANSHREITDVLLQTLLTVKDSEAISVCTFAQNDGEESLSLAVVRIGPEVTIVHRFDCSPAELEPFAGTEFSLVDVATREELPCFLRVPPFNDLEHKRFLILPIDSGDLSRGLLCLASTNAEAFGSDEIDHARHLTDRAALAFSNVNRMEELSHMNLGAMQALARAIDANSPWTAGHSERVTRVAVALGRRLNLDVANIDLLRRGGLLHDIGKIGVPVEVLNKPGALTDEEFERVKEHVTIGARILEPIGAYSDLLPIVLHHHERMDGLGYPHGLVGEDIPYLARIMAVADTFDALTSDRPYRKGLPFRTAVEVVRNAAGSQLDETVVAAFMSLVQEDSVELDLLNDESDNEIEIIWDQKNDPDRERRLPPTSPEYEPVGAPTDSDRPAGSKRLVGPTVGATL